MKLVESNNVCRPLALLAGDESSPGTAENSDQEGGTAESAANSEDEKGSSPMAMEEVENDVRLDARDDAGGEAEEAGEQVGEQVGDQAGEEAGVDEACGEWVDAGNDAGSYEEEADKPGSDQEDQVAVIEPKSGDEGEGEEASTTDLKVTRPSDNTTETTTESGVTGSGVVPDVDELSAVLAAEATNGTNSGERSAEEYGLDGPSPMDET